jgi:hypothetical protein
VQINNAYAAGIAAGMKAVDIHVAPGPSGCYTTATSIVLNTTQIPALLEGTPGSGTCITYTGSGVGLSFDWGMTGAGLYPHLYGAGLDNIAINCSNSAATICVDLGGGGRNAEGYRISNAKIWGAAQTLLNIRGMNSNPSQASFAGTVTKSLIYGSNGASQNCVLLGTYTERVSFDSDTIAECGTGINGSTSTGTDLYVTTTSFDDDVTAINFHGAHALVTGMHCENPNLLPTLCLDTSGPSTYVAVLGGFWTDDDNNATHTITQLWKVEGGASNGTNVLMDGTVVYSAGAIITQVVYVPSGATGNSASVHIFRTSAAVQSDINPDFTAAAGPFLHILGTAASGTTSQVGALQIQTNSSGGGCLGMAMDLYDANTSKHKIIRDTNGNLEIADSACASVLWRVYDTGQMQVAKAVATASLPVCNASMAGADALVNDSSVNTWGTTLAGGGTSTVKVFCDGAAWTVEAK